MLNQRLQACAAWITDGKTVCDVGTDHAYLAAELLRKERCQHVIASDIGEGPLQAARRLPTKPPAPVTMIFIDFSVSMRSSLSLAQALCLKASQLIVIPCRLVDRTDHDIVAVSSADFHKNSVTNLMPQQSLPQRRLAGNQSF